MYQVCVETIFAGRGEGLDELAPVQISFETDTITLRELITEAVYKQVGALNETVSPEVDAAQRQMRQQYLSDKDIAQLAESGRIAMDANAPGQLDFDACAHFALEGFKRKRYFVSINGTRPASLDDVILLLPNSEAQFVRLIPLVGG